MGRSVREEQEREAGSAVNRAAPCMHNPGGMNSEQMKLAEAEKHLQTMQEFRADLQQFLQVKRELTQLKEYADRDYMMGHFDPNAVEAKGHEILIRLQDWRTKVAWRLAEATTITDACGICLKVQPNATTGSFRFAHLIVHGYLKAKDSLDRSSPRRNSCSPRIVIRCGSYINKRIIARTIASAAARDRRTGSPVPSTRNSSTVVRGAIAVERAATPRSGCARG